MSESSKDRNWQLGLTSLSILSGLLVELPIGLPFLSGYTSAQITHDNSLGAEHSRLTPNVQIRGRLGDRIDGGAVRGTNLFHSFDEFNIRPEQRVYFANPGGIETIFSRVTGNNSSNIAGTLGVDGGANLFLLNPHGILFNAGARLDVRGSFVATTANAIEFSNQGSFSASQPDLPPLLTVDPSALLFNQWLAQPISAIEVRGAALSVPTGQTLSLVGGKVRLDGRQASLSAPSGRVELGGLAEAGTVGLSWDGNQPRLTFPDTTLRSPIEVTNGARATVLSTPARSGGNIAIYAGSFTLSNGATLLANSVFTTSAGDVLIDAQTNVSLINSTIRGTALEIGDAGNISMQAGGAITLDGTSILSNALRGGDSGSIDITAGSLSILNGSALVASTDGAGSAGRIAIQAVDRVSVDRSTIASSSGGRLQEAGSSNAGEITIQAASLALSDRTSLLTSTSGAGAGGDINITVGSLAITDSSIIARGEEGSTGDSGNIRINATDFITVESINPESINGGTSVTVSTLGTGDAGTLQIDTRSLEVRGGARIAAATTGQGQGGNIRVNASEAVHLTGASPIAGNSSGLFTTSELNSNNPSLEIGQGGEIHVTTGNLRIADGAVISARTRTGADGGTITVDANSLELTGGGQILTTAFSDGDAGDITINASDRTLLSGTDPTFAERLERFGPERLDTDGAASGLFARTQGAGAAGNLTISTRQLIVQEGAQISASTSSQGAPGSVFVRNADSVSLTNGAIATAVDANAAVNTRAEQRAGNIDIQTHRLSLTDGAEVTASTAGRGDAGNIVVREADTVTLNNGLISTSVRPGAVGQGGNIDVQARSVSLNENARISASTEGQGRAGNVAVTANTFAANQGGQLRTSTASGSDAGDITLGVLDWIRLEGDRTGLFASTESNSTGQGGAISVATGQLNVNHGAAVAVNSQGSGRAGDLDITARSVILDNQGRLTAETVSSESGDITLRGLNSLQVNNSEISAATATGRAGSLSVNATDSVQLRGAGGLSVAATNGGTAGNLTITTGQLMAQDYAQASVSSTAAGRAGNLEVIARNAFLHNGAELTAETESGSGGNIVLQVQDSLRMRNNSQLSASTVDGEGGRLTINANQNPAHSVTLNNNSRIATAATGAGNAGSLIVNTRQLTLNADSEISASTQSGVGGSIILEGLNSLRVNNGEISASTQTGRAGRLAVSAAESVELSGTGGLAVRADGTDAIAGNLTVTTGQLTVQDGAAVTVSNPQGQAGELTVNANIVRLNRGSLTAQTGGRSRQAGAILRLHDLDLLVMRNGSLISAEAFDEANGGNIEINAGDGFIVVNPLENNDIIANAEEGDGGIIDITTQSILGIVPRDELTPLSDINASSAVGVDGEVIINTPEVDPSQGLTELPTNVVDASQQIARGCPSQGRITAEELGSFTITGRGGLPPNPAAILEGEDVLAGWVTGSEGDGEDGRVEELEDSAVSSNSPSPHLPISPSPLPSHSPIVEAQGWAIAANGEVVLTAQVPETTSHHVGQTSPTCAGL